MVEAISVNWDTASQLVKLVGEFEKSKRDDQEIDFDEAVSKVAAAFGVEDVEATAENVLKEGASSVFGEDGSDQIARLIAGMCMPVGRCVYRYAAGGSSGPRTILAGEVCKNDKSV